MHEYYGLLHIDQVEAGVDSRSQEFAFSVQLQTPMQQRPIHHALFSMLIEAANHV
jgi:hypothetical protein